MKLTHPRTKLRSFYRVLPTQLSVLCRIALADVAIVERVLAPKVKIEMATWFYKAEDTKVCYVCAAGAVAMGRLKVPGDRDAVISAVTTGPNWKQLQAIDYLRQGMIWRAFLSLHSSEVVAREEFRNTELEHQHEVHSYSQNPNQWKLDMVNLVTLLETHGL